VNVDPQISADLATPTADEKTMAMLSPAYDLAGFIPPLVIYSEEIQICDFMIRAALACVMVILYFLVSSPHVSIFLVAAGRT